MDRIRKTIFMAAALFLPVFLCAEKAPAQSFGILSPKSQQDPRATFLSSEKGRFVFGQISDSSKDQFMLDTFSGRLWRISESGKIGLYLKMVPYCTDDGKCTPLPDKMEGPNSKGAE
jgi:hypothetical protein